MRHGGWPSTGRQATAVIGCGRTRSTRAPAGLRDRVWSRPDVHTVQYRLYCQVRRQVFPDGVLHQFEVPADEDVRRSPGGV